MATKVILFMVPMFLLTTAVTADVLVSEDFEGGYVEGPISGQAMRGIGFAGDWAAPAEAIYQNGELHIVNSSVITAPIASTISAAEGETFYGGVTLSAQNHTGPTWASVCGSCSVTFETGTGDIELFGYVIGNASIGTPYRVV